MYTYTHTRLTALFPGVPRWAGTRKVKANLDFTGARDGKWQWHQLGHMQVCTLLHIDNHASNPQLSFLQSGCPSCRPTNSVKTLKATKCTHIRTEYGYNAIKPYNVSDTVHKSQNISGTLVQDRYVSNKWLKQNHSELRKRLKIKLVKPSLVSSSAIRYFKHINVLVFKLSNTKKWQMCQNISQ